MKPPVSYSLTRSGVRRIGRNQFHESRRSRLLLFRDLGNGCKTALQSHSVQAQRMSHRIQTMPMRQFHRRLPQRLRNPGPMRIRTAKLLQPTLQLQNELSHKSGTLTGRILQSRRPQRLIERNNPAHAPSRSPAGNSHICLDARASNPAAHWIRCLDPRLSRPNIVKKPISSSYLPLDATGGWVARAVTRLPRNTTMEAGGISYSVDLSPRTMDS